MSNFTVDTNNLHLQQNKLFDIQNNINAISISLGTVCSGISSFSGSEIIKKNISANAQALEHSAQSLGVLATTLGSAVDLYNSAESKILGSNIPSTGLRLANTEPSEANASKKAFDPRAFSVDNIQNVPIRVGVEILQNYLENTLAEHSAEAIAASIMQWTMNTFPGFFMDRGLALSLANGGTMIMAEPPTWLASFVRSGAHWIAPAIGAAFDYTLQKARGEDTQDALVKTGAHTLIGVGTHFVGMAAGAKIGAVIGTAIPVPVVGTVIGGVLGAVGSVAFDYIYDNREAIGSAIVDTANNVGNWFGDRIEDAGKWINDTGAWIGNTFNNLGNAFSFGW